MFVVGQCTDLTFHSSVTHAQSFYKSSLILTSVVKQVLSTYIVSARSLFSVSSECMAKIKYLNQDSFIFGVYIKTLYSSLSIM